MSYGLIYTIPFASLEEVSYIVKIEKEGYDGESTELVAGANPFVVEISDEEFIYTPTRFSTATIGIVGSDYLRTLFSTDYRQFRVTLERNGVTEWCGYIKPELYTQDYSSDLFSLEMECMSAMSVLEYLDYTIKGEEKSFVSLWYLLERCIGESGGNYTSVYIPHVYASGASQYAEGENVLEKMLISEQDFFDEDDKPMKLKEVLEEICKFLNWTCVDWKGELYFVDIDHEGTYNKYDLSLAVKEEAGVNSLIVQDIGFAGSGHSLDILPGYNKVTVKCSNYPVGNIFPEEDFKGRIIDTYEYTSVEDAKIRNVMLLPDVYKAFYYWFSENENSELGFSVGWNEITEDFYVGLTTLYKWAVAGTKVIKRCEISLEDGKPTIYNYDYTDIIYLCPTQKVSGSFWNTVAPLPVGYPLVTMGLNLPCAMYVNGAIAIDMSIRIPSGGVPDDMDFQPIIMYFELSIGKLYYNGETWTSEKKYFGVQFENEDRKFESGNSIDIQNTKTLDMPYNGAKGYIIPIGETGIVGSPQLSIVGFFARGSGDYDSMKYQVGCYIEKVDVKYFKKDSGLYPADEDSSSDRVYENVLNEDYINELDEIGLKISSYNNDGACYSKVALDGNYLTDNLYNSILGKNKRPEELLITRIINHYSDTRIKLTQIVKNSKEISPLTILTDNFWVSKRFINAGGSIDYAADRFECIMIEK